jgi:hypothetical protein
LGPGDDHDLCPTGLQEVVDDGYIAECERHGVAARGLSESFTTLVHLAITRQVRRDVDDRVGHD